MRDLEGKHCTDARAIIILTHDFYSDNPRNPIFLNTVPNNACLQPRYTDMYNRSIGRQLGKSRLSCFVRSVLWRVAHRSVGSRESCLRHALPDWLHFS